MTTQTLQSAPVTGAASPHVNLMPPEIAEAARFRQIQALLGRGYGIRHSTLQVDHAPAASDHCGAADSGSHCADPHGATYRANRTALTPA